MIIIQINIQIIIQILVWKRNNIGLLSVTSLLYLFDIADGDDDDDVYPETVQYDHLPFGVRPIVEGK